MTANYFAGKTAIITGGASGVGRSLAMALGAAGSNVVVGDVDKSAMAIIDTDLETAGVPHRVDHCDVTQTSSLQAVLDSAVETFGQVDFVFANAGIGAGEAGPIWGYSEKDWQWCFNVNVWGVVNSINVFMPY